MPEKPLEHPDYLSPNRRPSNGEKGDPSNGENLDYDCEDQVSL